MDLNKQLLCFDIKELGSQLKIGMLVIQDQVWIRYPKTEETRQQGITSMSFTYFKEEQTASYSVEIWNDSENGRNSDRHYAECQDSDE